jgi:hypothetical protein
MQKGPFAAWALEWIELGKYPGRLLPRADERIEQALELWNRPIPGIWRRGHDRRLLDPKRRYCRGNHAPDAKRRGEHAIEYEILQPTPDEEATYVMGARLVDGVNAVPLAKDPGGRRAGNVEADMLLLVEAPTGRHRLEVVEVKVTSNNAWFASVENLRQLRLFEESPESRTLFGKRKEQLKLPSDIPFGGLVVGPRAFYSGRGQKGNAVEPAQELIDRFRAEVGVDVRLAVWEGTAIQPLERDV